MAPAWALGHDLAFLKETAGVFARAHKRHVYGAFGLIKERDIATALTGGSFFCIKSGEQVKAAAIASRLTRDSTHTDYAGRPLTLPAGTTYVKAIAGTSPLKLSLLLEKMKKPVAVEIFEEDEVAKKAVLVSGFTYLGTKVMAGGEIKGLYSRGAAFAFTRTYPSEPTLKMVKEKYLPAKWLARIRAELDQNSNAFAQHYSSYNKRKSWTAFSLRGYKPGDPTFIIKPAEMSRAWKEENTGWEKWECEDTTIAALFPNVWGALGEIPCAGYERVRFMRLAEKKGELSRHADITDRAAGLQPGRIARLHIPIYTSPLVKFRAWDERGQFIEETMAPGSLWYLDTRKPHSVVNEGDVVRVHLVADVICSKETVKWVSR